jgi:hypothetical protein
MPLIATSYSGWCGPRYRVDVIGRVDLMQGTPDLSGTPSLINTQVGDDVWSLPASVALACKSRRGYSTATEAACVRGDTSKETWKSCNLSTVRKVALTDDLRRAAGFGRGGHFPPAVARVGVRREDL